MRSLLLFLFLFLLFGLVFLFVPVFVPAVLGALFRSKAVGARPVGSGIRRGPAG